MMDYLPTFYGKKYFGIDWYNIMSDRDCVEKKYLFDMTYPGIGILYDTYGCKYTNGLLLWIILYTRYITISWSRTYHVSNDLQRMKIKIKLLFINVMRSVGGVRLSKQLPNV